MTTTFIADLFMIVSFVLIVIGSWRIFEDRGEKGWKALIPIYSTYILFKLFYQVKQFWYFVVGLIVFFISEMYLNVSLIMGILGDNISLSVYLSGIVAITSLVWVLYVDWKFSCSIANFYDKGTGFAVGLLLLPGIFLCILAYSKTERPDLPKININENRDE